MEDSLKQAASLFRKSNKIVVLTGAGISTESGIPDFRSAGGVYNDPKMIGYMSKSFFDSKPKEFWPKFKEIFGYKMRQSIKPNYGHVFLKELEDMGKEVIIITQNVDGLHTEAGSTKVFEAHGTIQTAFCQKCNQMYDLDYVLSHSIPRCSCTESKFVLKPSVVLFGDDVKYFNLAARHILSADLFVVMGSSLQVQPINGLVDIAYNGFWRASKKEKVEASKYCDMMIINKEETVYEDKFNLSIKGGIGETLSKVKTLL